MCFFIKECIHYFCLTKTLILVCISFPRLKLVGGIIPNFRVTQTELLFGRKQSELIGINHLASHPLKIRNSLLFSM